jgi:carbonic anhydrase
MDHLLPGIHQFRTQVFQREQQFFQELAAGQSPRVLFIGCSDSRVDPALITQTRLGELFILRNAGNIVPPIGASNGGEAACIEYAVSALGVKDIVICGHSQCGALKALLDPPSVESLPLVKDWLRHAESTRRILVENYPDLKGASLLETAIQEHVLMQIENLQTHPCVAAKLQRGLLTLHAWVYGLESGEIHAFCSETSAFIPIGEQAAKVGIPAPLQKRPKNSPPRRKR